MNACLYIDGDFARYSRDFHFSFPMQPGGHLTVEGFNGSVEVTPWDQANADISGTKYAPSQSQADAFKIDIDHTPSSLSIHAARQYESHGSYGVRFEIKVPRGTVIDRIATSNGGIHAEQAIGPTRLKSSNGAIRLEKFRGDLDAQTSNGPIELDDTEGALTLHTTNGHIHADAVKGAFNADTSNGGIKATVVRAAGEVRAETRNGSIDLTLPGGLTAGVRAHTSNDSITIRLAEPVNVRVSAHTSNSSISSDFDTRVRGDIRHNDFDGSIGSGGPLLDLSSSNGSIRILKE